MLWRSQKHTEQGVTSDSSLVSHPTLQNFKWWNGAIIPKQEIHRFPMLKSTMQKQIVHIKYYSEVQYNMIGKQSLLSCYKSPSILIFLSSKHTIIFQMSQNDLLKLQTVSFNAMNHITRTWACIIQLRSLQNHFLCREKKNPQLYHSPTARKPLIGDRKKVFEWYWRKSLEEVYKNLDSSACKSISEYCQVDGPSQYVFLSGNKNLKKLEAWKFPIWSSL